MNIVVKIRALRAKALDSACTEAEAALFAHKVQQLMEDHHISESQLDEKREEHVEVRFDTKHTNTWSRKMASVIGVFCGVDFAWVGRTGIYVGRPMLAETAVEMYHHLHAEVQRVTRNRGYTRAQKARAEKGAALRLMQRLEEIRTSLPESRLPVVQEFEAAREAMARMLSPRMKEVEIRIDSSEARAGLQMGEQIKIQETTE